MHSFCNSNLRAPHSAARRFPRHFLSRATLVGCAFCNNTVMSIGVDCMPHDPDIPFDIKPTITTSAKANQNTHQFCVGHLLQPPATRSHTPSLKDSRIEQQTGRKSHLIYFCLCPPFDVPSLSPNAAAIARLNWCSRARARVRVFARTKFRFLFRSCRIGGPAVASRSPHSVACIRFNEFAIYSFFCRFRKCRRQNRNLSVCTYLLTCLHLPYANGADM